MRHIDRRDSDGRSMGRKARAAKAEAAHARAHARQSQHAEQASAERAQLQRPEDLGRELVVHYEAPRRRTVASLTTDALCAGERVLAEALQLTVARDARIWLRGPNGAGKSTLLGALEVHVPALVLPQELDEAAASSLIEQLHALPPEPRGQVLQGVAALGVSPARLLATPRPSPGEARKLALALALAGPAQLLVLDEPTHHLDLPARLRLERALTAWPGALLLVTHDGALGRAVTDVTWTLDGQLTVS